MIGASTYSLGVGILLLIVTGVLPYSYWIIKLNFLEDDYGSRRTMPCCSCICQNMHRKKLERSVISKKVVGQEPGKPGQEEDEQKNNKSDKKEDVFRSKHPKSDIILKMKKKPQESKQADDDSTSKTPPRKRLSLQKVHDGESVFPIALPTEDKFSAASSCDLDLEEGSLSKSEGTANSVQFCNICLEEYKIGDEIAWSKNELCHHAFHKECIIEWLARHQDCPVCRNKY